MSNNAVMITHEIVGGEDMQAVIITLAAVAHAGPFPPFDIDARKS